MASTLESFTVQDMRDFRDACGFSMEQMSQKDRTDQATGSAALVWLLLRRSNPGATMAATLQMTPPELKAELDRLAPDLAAQSDPAPKAESRPDGTDTGSSDSPPSEKTSS